MRLNFLSKFDLCSLRAYNPISLSSVEGEGPRRSSSLAHNEVCVSLRSPVSLDDFGYFTFAGVGWGGGRMIFK